MRFGTSKKKSRFSPLLWKIFLSISPGCEARRDLQMPSTRLRVLTPAPSAGGFLQTPTRSSPTCRANIASLCKIAEQNKMNKL